LFDCTDWSGRAGDRRVQSQHVTTDREYRCPNRPNFSKYKDLAFERTEDGVVTLRFQTGGGPIVFTGQTHEDLPEALEEIALDPDNKALIITGTGDVFMDNIDGNSLGEIFKPAVWEKIRVAGSRHQRRGHRRAGVPRGGRW